MTTCELTKEQDRAVNCNSGEHLLISGKAGTGKTTALIHRAARVVSNDATGEATVTIVTLSNSMANWIHGVLRADFPEEIHSKIQVETVTSLCRLVRDPGTGTLLEMQERNIILSATCSFLADKSSAYQATIKSRITSMLQHPDMIFKDKDSKRAMDYYSEICEKYGLSDHGSLVDRATGALKSSSIFVDGLEDLNTQQWGLIKSFNVPITATIDANHQIYSFTGAHLQPLSDLLNEPGNRIALSTSFRESYYLDKLYDHFSSGSSAKPPIDQQDESTMPTFNMFEASSEETDWVCHKIASLIKNGIPASEIAVLTRTNKLMDKYAEALYEAGISFTDNSGPEAEFITLVKHLKEPDNPVYLVCLLATHADYSPQLCLRALKTGNVEVHDQSTMLFVSRLNQLSTEICESPNSIEHFESLLQKFVEEENVPLLKCKLKCFLEFVHQIRDQYPTGTVIDSIINNYWQLKPQRLPGNVTLTTVHSSKGLSFKYVFIPHLNDNVYPFFGAHNSPSAMFVEKQVLNVAFSSAKKYAFGSCSSTEWENARIRLEPSRFIKTSKHLFRRQDLDLPPVTDILQKANQTYPLIFNSPKKKTTTMLNEIGRRGIHTVRLLRKIGK